MHLLTVVHRAERTGPALLALQFLRWFRRARPEARLTTLFIDPGGDLESEFAELGPTIVPRHAVPYSTGERPHHRALVRHQLRRLRNELRGIGPVDVVHVHCAGSMRIASALPPAPVVCHLHELDVGLDLHLGTLARSELGTATRYIAVSDIVRDMFLNRFPIAPSKVRRQWGFVDPSRLPDARPGGVAGSSRSFTVTCIGVQHWRKAPELFVRTAVVARRRAPHVPWRFVWVGGDRSSHLTDLVRSAGLQDYVSFRPHCDDPLTELSRTDVFLLCAREDAFPLVVVEATALGVPTVTFDNGGAAELVTAAGCGAVVPFGDVHGTAAALEQLASDPQFRTHLGGCARDFASRHLLVDHAGPSIAAVLDAAMEAHR